MKHRDEKDKLKESHSVASESQKAKYSSIQEELANTQQLLSNSRKDVIEAKTAHDTAFNDLELLLQEKKRQLNRVKIDNLKDITQLKGKHLLVQKKM